jgi:cell division protein FtsL
MNDLFDQVILTIFAISIGAVIGLTLRSIYMSKDKANMPTQDEIHRLFPKIQEWKKQKQSYSEMVYSLKKMGYRKNAADIILGEMVKHKGLNGK